MRLNHKTAYAAKRDKAFRLAKRKRRGKPLKPAATLIEDEHAMKVDLGFVDYRQFYYNILLSAVKDLDLKVSDKIVLNELLDNDRFGIETTEKRMEELAGRHSKSDKGALYRVSMQIPGRVPARFFVKRCIDNATWERSFLLDRYISKDRIAARFVPQVKYTDKKTRLLAYEFIDGNPLYSIFRTVTEGEKEHMLRKVIEAIFTTSESIVPSRERNWHRRNNSNGEAFSLEKKGNHVEIGEGKSKYKLRSLNDPSGSLLRLFVIRGNSTLEDRLTAWDGNISQKDIERLKEKYKSVQPLLDSYKDTAEILGSEELCFSHGDLHLANILWTEECPKIIDWEYAVMAPRQFDLLKLLKKAGISKGTEERLLKYAFMVHETAELRNRIIEKGKTTLNRRGEDGEIISEKMSAVLERELTDACRNILASEEADKRFERFRKAYRALEFHENLLLSSKYLNYSDKSETPEHRRELREMANCYYTHALNYVRGAELEQRIKDVVEEVMDGRLIDLKDRASLVPTPLARVSVSNWGHASIIEKIGEKETTKSRVVKAAGYAAAAAAVALIGTFGVTSELARRDSENFIRENGAVPQNVEAIPHSKHVDKYARMYNVDPLMLEAAVNYVVLNNVQIPIGAAAKYMHDPEQFAMSIAKKMHDIAKKQGENYPAIFAELYGNKQTVANASRLGITGRYVDFRRMHTPHVRKVADTMAMSGYYAKQRQRQTVAKWRR